MIHLRPSRLLLLAPLALPSLASAHGLFGHVHVTGWAIENLPPGELRTFFEDPELKEAALTGAMLPDTGYAGDSSPAARAYGEHTHWEPFIESYVQRLRAEYGPGYDTQEERKLIAFMLGAASHGLQDELFDSTFLFESEQRDPGAGQDNVDPGTDGFLVQDGLARMYPGDDLPLSDLLPLYASLPEAADINADLIEHQTWIVRTIYLNDGVGLRAAAMIGEANRPDLPWTAAHYLDAAVPGAHRAEILPTMAHMQALWERVHGTFERADLVVHRWPEPGRRLRQSEHDSVASWVTLVLGQGIEPGSATATLVDSQGRPHPFELAYTRWGGVSRIVRFQATEDYLPGETYTATLEAGALLVDGTVTAVPYSHTFQVDCARSDDPACPPLPPVAEPRLEPVAAQAAEPQDNRRGCSTTRPVGDLAWIAAALLLARRRRGRRWDQRSFGSGSPGRALHEGP